ncbi:FtsH-binding integral membrane protein [Curtobacterium luteum]|uniref:FtsH-binding integral membrane protein n=1 Tax=Curtobacterium luteum TaxID=33881 RepID=A0A8H9G9H8_9MICO|nr:hypothetical protein [Curtobacterium luteum]MBM7801457.1 FtsH-binding integral membrane protein [Curtobacterium luteum]NUU50044.1 hypothetical protein [Curtobacterium luteum]GGK90312.1 hypothetical protein GCM10009769_05480 [Curtobacterium luteum]
MNTQQIVPATRSGLVLSIVGFAIAATLMASSTARTALATPYGLAWILLVVLMVYPPRMIRPGPGWARQRCRTVPATVLYVAAVVVALGGATWAVTAGAVVAACTGALTLGIATVAATLPTVTRPEQAPHESGRRGPRGR